MSYKTKLTDLRNLNHNEIVIEIKYELLFYHGEAPDQKPEEPGAILQYPSH